MADQNCRIRSQGKRESGKIRGNLEAPSHNVSTALENATHFWYWAVMQAAHEYRCQILGTPLPDTAPRFGDRVLIQKTLATFFISVQRRGGTISFLGYYHVARGTGGYREKWELESGFSIRATSLAEIGKRKK